MTPALSAARVLVVVLDRQGRIVRFNHACEHTTGYLYSEVKNQRLGEILLAPEESESVLARFDSQSIEETQSAYEHYWVTKCGERRLISWTNTVLRDDTDEVQSIICTGIDITECLWVSEGRPVVLEDLARARQQAIVSGLIAAQEEERRSVAYELHDGLTQFVMAAHAHFESFRRAHTEGKEDQAERELAQGLKYLKEAVLESRRMVNGLRSLALEDLGLAGALEQLLSDEKESAGWQSADLIHNIDGRRFDPTLETAVYRVAQEAISNARKHAVASRICVTLLIGPDERPGMELLSLAVRDWGKGFSLEQQTEDYAHFGLHGMSVRVHLLRGVFELQSSVGIGTTVRARFPILEQKPSNSA